jgi:hypothetical protein
LSHRYWTWDRATDRILSWRVPAGFAIGYELDGRRRLRLRVWLVYRCGHFRDRWLDPRRPLPDVHAMLSIMAVRLLAGHCCCMDPIVDGGLARRGREFDRWAYKYSRRFARRRKWERIL